MTFLEIIQRTIEEHRKVRSDVGVVGHAANDMEAMFSIQRSHAGWAQGSLEALPQSIERLRQAVEVVNEGLRRHYGFEEQYLPPVFGETLMKALVLEHGEVRGKLSACVTSINADVGGMAQEGLLTYRSGVQQAIGDLMQSIEAHASREEVVLHMIARALEAEQKAKEA